MHPRMQIINHHKLYSCYTSRHMRPGEGSSLGTLVLKIYFYLGECSEKEATICEPGTSTEETAEDEVPKPKR